ncbi:hypothetical protein ES707_01294 [subsurface metagenome]
MAKAFSAIRATVRQLLRDEFQAAGTDFADDELDIHINEVLVEISQKRPYEVKDKVVSTGSKELDISSITDLLEVEKAEYPTGNDPPDYRDVSIFGNTARLNIATAPTSGDDVYLYCHKVHQLTESASTLSPDLEKVLVEGVVAKAALAWCNQMRSQIVPQSYRWYQTWANNHYLIYQNSLRGITRPRVWEFYPRG